MKYLEAKAILAVPIFGDPKCIEALKLLRDIEKATELRDMLAAAGVSCECDDCGGTGECQACDGTGEDADLESMEVTDLMALAKENNIDVSGVTV